MTDQTAHGAVKVAQEDRDAAADSSPHNERWGLLVRAGHMDHDTLVQAFARHRLASLSPTTPDAVRGEVEDLTTKLRMVIAHASGGKLEYDPLMPINDICVEISKTRNQIYEAGKARATLHPSLEDPIGGQDVERGLTRKDVEQIAQKAAENIFNGFSFETLNCPESLFARLKMAAREAAYLAALRAPVERKGVLEEAANIVDAERHKWFCSGPDCSPYDHGRDEGFEMARDALRKAAIRNAAGEKA